MGSGMQNPARTHFGELEPGGAYSHHRRAISIVDWLARTPCGRRHAPAMAEPAWYTMLCQEFAFMALNLSSHIFFKLYLCIYIFVCLCVRMCTVPWYICGCSRTTCGSSFSLLNKWVLGIKLWSSGLVAGTLPAEPCCWFLALLGFENTGIGGGECATPHRPDWGHQFCRDGRGHTSLESLSPFSFPCSSVSHSGEWAQ